MPPATRHAGYCLRVAPQMHRVEADKTTTAGFVVEDLNPDLPAGLPACLRGQIVFLIFQKQFIRSLVGAGIKG